MKIKTGEFWDNVYNSEKDFKDLTDNQIEIIFGNLHTNSKILDIGSGTGKLLKLAEEKGFEAFGIESSEIAKVKSIEKGVLAEVKIIDVEDIEEYEDNRKYNKIVLKLVIAFIKNKINLLEWIKDHLESEGELIIITPISNKENKFPIKGISVNQNELEKALTYIFGSFEVKDKMDDKGGIIMTYSCRL